MPDITELAPGLYCIDLNFQGLPGVIASYVLSRDGEHAIIETGPTSSLETLLRGLQHLGIDPRAVNTALVTHIHLDHAGAAGTLVEQFPQIQLYVHEVGAPHLIDPSKLLASATRIYGERMGPLWGEVLPVPAGNVHPLMGGDSIKVAAHEIEAVYTPGHASHHVVYWDRLRGDAFSGDVTGVRLQDFATIRPPTPPPDIDLVAWRESLHRITDLNPQRLLLTHFGPHYDIADHLRETESRLQAWSEVVRRDFDAGLERDEIVRHLESFAQTDIAGADDPSAAERYELATPTYMSADGLVRYFRKQQK